MKVRPVVVSMLVVLLLAPALTLTAARFAQPAGGFWVRLISFTPYAVVSYLVVLVLLVVVSLRSRGAGRQLSLVAALVAVLGLALHVVWLWPALTARPAQLPGPVAADQPNRAAPALRVMTVNLLLGGASAERVVELVRANRVNVLVLEEVTAPERDQLAAAGLDVLLPHEAGAPGEGYTGTMVFARRPLSDVTRLPTESGSYLMSIGSVRLVAFHSAPPLGDARAWFAEHRLVEDVVAQELGTAEGGLVVAGDLNATTDHEPLLRLRLLGLSDAATAGGSRWQPTWPAQDGPTVLGVPVPPMLAIDHVLVDDRLAVVSTRTADVEGSDHRALVAVLTPTVP